ncbi:hypothetical protein [Streptomyces sp. NPDC021020]|uniref:hypothetical protein n=1 Tax=Streptomyces sp. NPDC021020 TaxID=3365109 RepID=UPI0037B48045
MSAPSSDAVRPFGDLPVVRRGDRWLLAAGSATVSADRALAADLDAFAAAMAAADRAVAALHPRTRGRR